MTLQEVIKKYEGAKKILEKRHPELTTLASLCDCEQILRDLRSIEEQQPSWVTLRHKIMEKIDKALENDDPNGACTLAQLLKILPS